MNILILSCGTRNKVVQYFKNLSANPEDTSSMPDLGRSHILHSKVSAFTTDVEPCSRAWNFNF